MDFLQIALILLIIILGIFLSITGLQIFFILRDLKKALDRFNEIIFNKEPVVEEKIKQAAKKSGHISLGNPRRFFKKAL